MSGDKIGKYDYFELLAKLISRKRVSLTLGRQSSVNLTCEPYQVIVNQDGGALRPRFELAMGNLPAVDVSAISRKIGASMDEITYIFQRTALYHEAGHILFTPSDWITIRTTVDRKNILNALEDMRIESAISRKYPGLKDKFVLMNKLLLANGINDDLIKTQMMMALGGNSYGQITGRAHRTQIVMLMMFQSARISLGLDHVTDLTHPAVKLASECMTRLSEYPKASYSMVEKYAKDIEKLIPEVIRFDDLPKDWVSQVQENERKAQEEKEKTESPSEPDDTKTGESNADVPDGANGDIPKPDEPTDQDGNASQPTDEPTDDNEPATDPLDSEIAEGLHKALIDARQEIRENDINLSQRVKKNSDIYGRIKNGLVNSVSSKLCQIIGSGPSQMDYDDYDGQEIDIPGYLEHKITGDETKMFINSGKRIRPEFNIVILADTSGSMNEVIDRDIWKNKDGSYNQEAVRMSRLKNALANFIFATEKAGIKTHVLGFGTRTCLIKSWGQMGGKMNYSALEPNGNTSIIQAIHDAFNALDKVENGPNVRKAIILMTDGGCDDWADVATQLMERGQIEFYMVSIDSPAGKMYRDRMALFGCQIDGYTQVSSQTLTSGLMNLAVDIVRHR